MRKATGFVSVVLFFLLIAVAGQALAQAQAVEKAPIKVMPKPTIIALLPDLVVKDFKPDPANTKHATVRVINQGQGSAKACKLRLEIFYGKTPPAFTHDFDVPALAKAAGATIDINATVDMGTGGLCNCLQRFTVNPPPTTIQESNTTNNVLNVQSYLY